MFANGENGFWYDFSKTDRTFQGSTGQTLADDDGENVGLALEQSKWAGKTLAELIAAQPDLIVNGAFNSDTAWTKNTGWTISAGKAHGEAVASAQLLAPSSAVAAVVGRAYLVTYEISNYVSGGVSFVFGGINGIARSSAGTFTEIMIAISTATFNMQRRLVDFTGSIDNISVKEIPGNHGLQATAGARPVRKTGGFLRFDGADDNLLTTLNPSAAMTLVAKIKATSGAAFRVAIGSTDGTNRAFLGKTNAEKLFASVGTQTETTINSGPLSIDGTTGIAAVVVDATNVTLFWNGVSVYGPVAKAGTSLNAFPMRVGAANLNGSAVNLFLGDIYQILAINRALTPSEILQLTNSWGTS